MWILVLVCCLVTPGGLRMGDSGYEFKTKAACEAYIEKIHDYARANGTIDYEMRCEYRAAVTS